MVTYYIMGKARKNSKTFKKELLKTESFEDIKTFVEGIKKDGYGIVVPYILTHLAFVKDGNNNMIFTKEYNNMLVSPSKDEVEALKYA